MYREDERDFLFDHITNVTDVLEYGSGESSIEIAKEARRLVTVEHMSNWFEHISEKLPTTSLMMYAPKDDGQEDNLVKPEHGPAEEWAHYISAPSGLGPFDVIFIDGSARVGCASMCKELGHENTTVFIHDWQGQRFSGALQYLDHIETVFTMAKLKIKQ